MFFIEKIFDDFVRLFRVFKEGDLYIFQVLEIVKIFQSHERFWKSLSTEMRLFTPCIFIRIKQENAKIRYKKMVEKKRECQKLKILSFDSKTL